MHWDDSTLYRQVYCIISHTVHTHIPFTNSSEVQLKGTLITKQKLKNSYEGHFWWTQLDELLQEPLRQQVHTLHINDASFACSALTSTGSPTVAICTITRTGWAIEHPSILTCPSTGCKSNKTLSGLPLCRIMHSQLLGWLRVDTC